ncbi:MAG: hypothetical protein WCE79_23200 [Xanthobacteraceae bacterium]
MTTRIAIAARLCPGALVALLMILALPPSAQAAEVGQKSEGCRIAPEQPAPCEDSPIESEKPDRPYRESGSISSQPPSPSRREIKEQQRRADVERERSRIRDNLSDLDANLAAARQRQPSPPPKAARPSEALVMIRRAALAQLLKDAQAIQPLDIGPMTERIAINRQRSLIDESIQSAWGLRVRNAIVADTPLKLALAESGVARSYASPWYQNKFFEELRGPNDLRIIQATRGTSVEPDLVRAIIWMETTHGWYDRIFPDRTIKSIRPMNIYVQYWRGLGITLEDMEKPGRNIATGVKILSGLKARLENPSIEKIATLYNDLAANSVSSYGKTVAEYYRTKPWLQPP